MANMIAMTILMINSAYKVMGSRNALYLVEAIIERWKKRQLASTTHTQMRGN